jgi:hypothetical protein
MIMKMFGLALKALFSILAIIIGCSLIVWVIYNEFIALQPEYQRPPWAGSFMIAFVMIGAGVHWAKQAIGQLRGKKHIKG